MQMCEMLRKNPRAPSGENFVLAAVLMPRYMYFGTKSLTHRR